MATAFGLVLGLRVRNCLPVHIRRCVGTTAFQCAHVIDNVARACATGFSSGRTRCLSLECRLCSLTPLYFSVLITLNRRVWSVTVCDIALAVEVMGRCADCTGT